MITALDQEIARVLNGNTKSGDKILGLIALLREKDQIIANLEQHNTTLRDCLKTRNEQIANN